MTWTYKATTPIAAVASSFTLTTIQVGDFIWAEVASSSATGYATALSSAGVTWASAGSVFHSTQTTIPSSSAVFFGTVTSVVTNTTVTITSSGTPGNYYGCCVEFLSSVGSWALDVQGNIDSAGGTTTWASLTPTHGAGELYVGYAQDNSAAVAGTTSGFVWNASVDTHGNGMCYNPNCANAATAPVWGDAQQITGVMMLIYETGAAPAGLIPQQLRHRAPKLTVPNLSVPSYVR